MATLTDIYHAYKTKKISLDELKSKTLETIFKEKYYYNVHKFNNDDLADLILHLSRYLGKIIEKYDENKSSYAVYIRNSVELVKKAKLFRNIKKESSEDVIKNYVIEEANLSIEEPQQHYTSKHKTKLDLDFEKIVYTPKQKKLTTISRIKIIVLKSCYYLSDDNLFHICEEFNIPFEEMKRHIEIAKESMYWKTKKYTAEKNNKNRVYFLRNRYKYELERLSINTETYKKIEKSLELNTKLWEKYTSSPYEKIITPSNVIIGKILNIPYHTINNFFNDMKNYRKNDKKGLS